MNDIRLLAQDAASLTVAFYDDDLRRWYEAQLQKAHRYAEFVLGLARKGKLTLPAKALRQLLVVRPGDQKMVSIKMMEGKLMDYESKRFLSSVADLDDDVLSIKSLSKRGYDSDGDVISYQGVALWPASALNADDDRPATKAMRAALDTILSPDYTRTFARFLELTFTARGAATTGLSDREWKALRAGSDVGGGYLVPADFVGNMLSRVVARSIVRAAARVVPTVRDKLVMPAFHADASLPSVYSSGFRGSWVAEEPLWSDDDPGVGAFECPVKKLRVACKVSRSLVNDAGGIGWLTTSGADNIAAAEDQAFLNGSGAIDEPEGILNAGLGTTNIAGTTANTISNTVSDAGSGPKMLTLAGSLPSQYQRDAVLICRSETEASINKLVDGNGAFLYPRRRGADGRRESLGYPVENSPHVPADGTAANLPVLLGDLAGYVVATRSMISLVLQERFADTDQLGVLLIDRIGGAVYNADAFRAGVV